MWRARFNDGRGVLRHLNKFARETPSDASDKLASQPRGQAACPIPGRGLSSRCLYNTPDAPNLPATTCAEAGHFGAGLLGLFRYDYRNVSHAAKDVDTDVIAVPEEEQV